VGAANESEFKAESSAETELQGRWTVSVFDFRGYWLTAYGPTGEYYRNMLVTFKDRTMHIRSQGKREPTGVEFIWDHLYKIAPNKTPKEIDVTHTLWSDDGKPTATEVVWRGIYDIQGDRLVICLNRSENAKRPKEFTTEGIEGRQNTILLLEREKKK
jgi:uncharacterized protein (TIGR03067 family)